MDYFLDLHALFYNTLHRHFYHSLDGNFCHLLYRNFNSLLHRPFFHYFSFKNPVNWNFHRPHHLLDNEFIDLNEIVKDHNLVRSAVR